MLMPAILSLLVGAVLGLRFRVFVLVPATILAWVLMLAFDAIGAASVGGFAAIAIMTAVSMQIGYLCGVSTRFVLASSRAIRSRSQSGPVLAGSETSGGQRT